MPYIPWGDHRGGRLELAFLPRCSAPWTDHLADPPAPGGGCLSIDGAADFHLPVHKFPEFVGTLYEAAGQPAPILLDRPQIPGTTTIFLGGYSVMRDGPAVTVVVGREERCLPPDKAREYAAAIAARADEAEDNETVRKLAAVVRSNLPGMAKTADEIARDVAQAVLARYDLTERTP